MGKTRQAISILRDWLKSDPWPVERYGILTELRLFKARFPETSGINDAIELVDQTE